MRFERLLMRRYGPFLERELAFDPGAQLHLVYGPNGAGKSTALQALRSVLFGIRRDEAKFRYAAPSRRLGATLLRSDGERISYLRRSSPKQPLWCVDDEQALDASELTPFLGGLDEDVFRRLFGLDLEALRAGGEDLIEQKADLEHSLFSAALGAERLGAVRRALEEERTALFTGVRQGRSKVALGVKEHRELAARRRDAERSQTALQRTRRQLAQLEERAAELEAQRRATVVEAKGLAVLAEASRVLRRRALLAGKRAELDVDGEGLQEAEAARVLALKDGIKAREAAAETTARVERELETELGEAQEHREQLEGAAPPGADVDPGEARATLGRLGRALDGALSTRDRSEAALERVRAEHRGALEALGAVAETATARWSEEFEALTPFRGDAQALERLPVPPPGALDRLAQREAAAESARDAARGARRDAESAVLEAREALDRARSAAGGDVPAPEAVAEARDVRDRALDSALAAGEADAARALEVTRLVELADAAVDRRLEVGDLEADVRRAERDLAVAEARSARAAEELAASEAEREEVAGELIRLTAPLGFTLPERAAEVAAWCAARASLLERLRAAREQAEGRVDAARGAVRDEEASLADAERKLQRAKGDLEAWATERGLDASAGREALDGSLRRREEQNAGLARAREQESRIAAKLARVRSERAREQEEQAASAERLSALAETHAGGSVERLELAARRAGEVKALDDELRTLDDRLGELCPGRGPLEVLEEIGDRTLAELEAEHDELDARAQGLQGEREALGEELGRARRELEGGGDGAATVAAEMAQVEAELEGAAERFTELVVAEHLLEREARRYRQTMQGPLLARAREIFRTLTLGAFSSLQTGESAGKDVLLAQRPDGELVPVGARGMSEGTADQLYLALRIATVEQSIRGVEPMPFLADDLFTTFDDDRTAAGLRVLAELGQRTQVIVFTHHRPVVDSARELGLGDRLDVIELEAETEREARQAPAAAD